MLLNSQALCFINQGKYEDAVSLLQEALDKVKKLKKKKTAKFFKLINIITIKDSNNPDAMVNMIVLNQHLGKPIEVSNRYISQLKDSHKNHPFVRDLLLKVSDLFFLEIKFL